MIEIISGIYQIPGSKYTVDSEGNVTSSHRSEPRILKLSKGRDGYLAGTLTIEKKAHYFKRHRLLAQAFIFNPENKPQVNHINGIKDDNRLENLEWVTASENSLHAVKLGLKTGVKGVKNKFSKLTDEIVLEIRKEAETRKKWEKSWLKYGISYSTFYDIAARRTWKHI